VREALGVIRCEFDVFWENVVNLNVLGIGDAVKFVHGILARIRSNN